MRKPVLGLCAFVAIVYFIIPVFASDMDIVLDTDGSDSSMHIQSDSSNEVFKAQGNGYIGVGTASPAQRLHIYGNPANLRLERSSAASVAIEMRGDRSYANQDLACIQGYWNGHYITDIRLLSGPDTTNKDDGQIAFYTSNGGSNPIERLRITNDGKVGVGDSTPSVALDVYGSVRADAYVEYSPIYVGNDALTKINKISFIPNTIQANGWAEVDHSTLPQGVKKQYVEKWVRNKLTGAEVKKGRVVYPSNITTEEDKRNHLIAYYAEFDKVVEGRDMGATVQLLMKAIKELSQRVDELERQLAIQ